MSSESSQSPSPLPNTPGNTEFARLKRQLAAAQDEIKELNGMKAKKTPTATTTGRGVRRLVSMYDSVDDIIQAADKHNDHDQGIGEQNDDGPEKKRELESRLTAFKILLQAFPIVKKSIEDPEVDFDIFVGQLQKGANDARSDDLRRVKEELALWLNVEYAPNPPLEVKERFDRGRQHDITGRLLCPIEYDWDDEGIRNGIRAGTIDISEDYFLRCFYPHGSGNSNNVEEGFLRSGLLINVYKVIFTSPSSSDVSQSASSASVDNEDENPAPRKKPRSNNPQKKATKCNVATILGMEGRVTPRSIAYATVMLAFNLTNANAWTEVYNHFDYRALYALVVDFFEVSGGQAAAERTDSLLEWWNGEIFPHHIQASTNIRKSQNKLVAQRAARERRG